MILMFIVLHFQFRFIITITTGDKKLLNGLRCKVTQMGDRHQTTFYSSKGQKLKSVMEVAKFLNLTSDKNGNGQKAKASIIKKTLPRNLRELENEKKKLRRELDKLMKNHEKASKALDDFRNEKSNDQSQIDDEFLPSDPNRNKAIWGVLSKPELDSFPGLPPSCTQDVLMVWNFLCTFNRTLSLHPIALDEFAAALVYKPTNMSDSTITHVDQTLPLYLAESHLSLLKLLLTDQSSDSWWWSTLETPETEALEESARGEADNVAPTIKMDFKSLLDYDEDISVTRKWLQALEDVRTKRTNAGASIKSAVKSAASLTTNPQVKTYLRKAMRGWRGNEASFTKQSVMWLIGRFREARPDLWGRRIDAAILIEQREKVVREATNAMELLEDDNELDNGEDIQYGDSDGEDSDSDDDDTEMEAGTQDNFRGKRIENMQASIGADSKKMEDTSTLVITCIPDKPPPTLIDLFLPPSKPLWNSHVISPFTWPYLVGACVGRILHRYKRLRNEVDDSLREFRDLKPMTIAERKRREKLSSFRIFSECMSTKEDTQECPIEYAVEHLANGKNYLDLIPLQRLCILRVLVEASYDTFSVHQCVQNNIQARISASKQLDSEERRAKKEAREAAAAVESAARERLAKLAKDEFISKKRREIIRKNKLIGEFTEEQIESLGDEEIAEFDEEIKAEYDALPGPKQFSRNEVRATVEKINEETAFGTIELEVLTLEEIESREATTLIEMEEELAGFGDPANIYNRDTSAKINSLKRQIENFKEWQETLPTSRSEATGLLKEAMEDGTIKSLRSAIRNAKQALLCGDDEETGGMWAYDLLRDAALELKQAERRKRVTEAQKDLVAKRNKCFVRTEVIGKDRDYNNYWHFDNDVFERIWFDVDFRLSSEQSSADEATPAMDAEMITIGPSDEEQDIANPDDKDYVQFSRKEYHPAGKVHALVRRHNGCLSSSSSLRAFMKNLDGKGVREGSLKAALKEVLEGSGGVQSASVDNGDGEANEGNKNLVQKSGDEQIFQESLSLALNDPDSFGEVRDAEMVSSLHSAIGQRCRLRTVADEISAPDVASYAMGTITGWRMKKTVVQIQQQQEDSDAENTQMLEESESVVEKEFPVWSISLDKGGEEDINALDMFNGLIRAKKWKHQYPGYVENDSPLFTYRNKVGRFCGRAADAPYASSPLFFSKLMIKREQEHYSSLKSRAYDTSWGGRDGLRNVWIASMKENFDDINVLRDGLLTLEQAFYDLCNGDINADNDDQQNARSAKELLSDVNLRCDIELESLGLTISGLWHCQESRIVFREIISCKFCLTMPHTQTVAIRLLTHSLYLLCSSTF